MLVPEVLDGHAGEQPRSVRELSCRVPLEHGKSEILLPAELQLQQLPGYSGSARMGSAPGQLSHYLLLTALVLILLDI